MEEIQRVAEAARDRASESAADTSEGRGALEDAIDRRRVTLAQVLALEYIELRGPLIERLERLFDVSNVPATGFEPPKFQTAYDTYVDVEMMERMDAVLAAEPRLTFALPFDLNVFAPAYSSVFSRDCTGDPAEDLKLNRTKRFFLDSPALTRAARMDLGVELPARRMTRSEIERSGAQPRPAARGRAELPAPDLRARHRCRAQHPVRSAVCEGTAVRCRHARVGSRAATAVAAGASGQP